jgi:hypothetical protein
MINGIHGGTIHQHRPISAQIFKKMDKNGDGGLDAAELTKLAKRTGQDANALLGKLDGNKDGKVVATELEAGKDNLQSQMLSCKSPEADGPGSSTSIMIVMMQVRMTQSSATNANDVNGGDNPFMQQASQGNEFMQADDGFGSSMALADILQNWQSGGAFTGSKPTGSDQPSGFKESMKEMTTAMMNVMDQLQAA